MLEDIAKRLLSIQPSLNEVVLKRTNELDLQLGFDPTQEYDHSRLARFYGITAFIEASRDPKKNHDAKYLLMEVRLKNADEQRMFQFLRGFEQPITSHAYIANTFLKSELQGAVAPHFILPIEWPSRKTGFDKKYYPIFNVDHGGNQLCCEAIGGGKFAFNEGALEIFGDSTYFGAVPSQYRDVLLHHLRNVLQHPCYAGLRLEVDDINMSEIRSCPAPPRFPS